MKSSSIAFALTLATAACTLSSSKSDEPSPPAAAPPASASPSPADAPAEAPALATDPAPTPSPGKAMVRAIHGSPDAPAVDVYVRGQSKPIFTNLAYGGTSNWIEVAPGSYEIEVRVAGAPSTDSAVYTSPPLDVAAGQLVDAIAAGLVGSQEPESQFRLLAIREKFGATNGDLRVRAIHAGSDAPTVDLDVGNDDPTKPEIAGVKRFADTGEEGASLPAGRSLALGIAAGGGRVTAFTTPALPPGSDLLAIATGLLEGGPRARSFGLLVVGGRGTVGFVKQDPIVYALHGSPDAPRIDAFVGATEIIGNLGFGELSSPIQVPPGSYTLDIFGTAPGAPLAAGAARPAGAPVLSAETGKLDAGERYLAIANGFVANLGIGLYREQFDLDKTRLRAIHASPDAPAVDLGLVTGTKIDPVVFANLEFKASSSEIGVAVDPAHLPVGVTPAGQNASLVVRSTLPVSAGERAFVIAGGALDSRKGQSFRFFAIDTARAPWTLQAIYPH